MAANITFPLIPGTTTRRNAETGVEIVKGKGGNYLVILGGVAVCSRLRLAAARTEAIKHAEAVRATLGTLVADPDARARRQFPSVFEMLDK